MIKERTSGLILCAIVLCAALLRFFGLRFGLPEYFFHPDESTKVGVLVGMIERNSLSPNYFLHPSLLLYLTLATRYLLSDFGLSGGLPEQLLLSGRIVSAIAGTLSVGVLGRLGTRLYSRPAGLLAAACLAFSPLHVTCSRYLKEDALLVFFVLITVHFLVKGLQEDRPLWLLAGGFFAGMAAGSKYSGVLCIALAGLSPWIRGNRLTAERGNLWIALTATGLAILAFALCCPYAFTAYSSFRRGVLFESRHMLQGHDIAVTAWSQWWTFHLHRSLIPGLTPFAAALGLLGLILNLGRRRWEDLFVIGVFLLFYLPAEWVRAKIEPQPERYILPCIPFLAISGAAVAARIKPAGLRLAVSALFLALPLARSAALASELEPDTRRLMAAWVHEHIPAGSHLCVDFRFYSPLPDRNQYKVTELRAGKSYHNFRLDNYFLNQCAYLLISSFSYRRFQQGALAQNHIGQSMSELLTELPIVHEERSRYGSFGFHNPDLKLLKVTTSKSSAVQ